jgi:hypothetical protein
MLVAFFLLFCALVAGAGIMGWRYYTNATMEMPPSTVRVHAQAGVDYQSKGSRRFVTPEQPCPQNPPDNSDVCVELKEGDRVRAKPEAGYGPVASIKLPAPDQTQIDLWAHPTGADLTLDTYQVSRWTGDRQEVVVRQSAGYARYDIRDDQSYEQVSYTVKITDGVAVTLAPGGSYSINVPQDRPGKPPVLTASGQTMLVEVAVRSGSATILAAGDPVVLTVGEKSQVDLAGRPGAPVLAEWNLVRDGDFTEYAAGASTWSLYGTPGAPMADSEMNGTFTVVQSCRPRLEIITSCRPDDQAYMGRFRREGRQTNNYITGIVQELDVDVSEYTSLRLMAWARVVTQTVELAGVRGSECPIMIWMTYKRTSPTDAQQERSICVYAVDSSTAAGSEDAGEISYRPVNLFQWYPIDIQLRDDPQLKEVRYLQKIRIEARGHDYMSEITGIRLIGMQRPLGTQR